MHRLKHRHEFYCTSKHSKTIDAIPLKCNGQFDAKKGTERALDGTAKLDRKRKKTNGWKENDEKERIINGKEQLLKKMTNLKILSKWKQRKWVKNGRQQTDWTKLGSFCLG